MLTGIAAPHKFAFLIVQKCVNGVLRETARLKLGGLGVERV